MCAVRANRMLHCVGYFFFRSISCCFVLYRIRSFHKVFHTFIYDKNIFGFSHLPLNLRNNKYKKEEKKNEITLHYSAHTIQHYANSNTYKNEFRVCDAACCFVTRTTLAERCAHICLRINQAYHQPSANRFRRSPMRERLLHAE